MPTKTEWARELAAKRIVRKVAGLQEDQGVHPAPEAFFSQYEALACLQKLLDQGEYSPDQLGLFADETGEGGKRKFLVDTFAGFALDRAPHFDNQRAFIGFEKGDAADSAGHLYEVILENRPCWLYFDLEYHRPANPFLQPEEAMAAFRATLVDFCREVLGAPPDESGIIELDSSTDLKFSKHVLVKRLQGSPPQHLALANNAQAGLLVGELIAYAHGRRHVQGSPCRALFVQAKPAKNEPPDLVREEPLIDESVYSRNRSFRLMYNTKFGKKSSLRMSREDVQKSFSRSEYPPLQLLHTMASFVPPEIQLFHHALIPAGYVHSAARARVTRVSLDDGTTRQQSEKISVGAPMRQHQLQQSGLFQHLIEAWDAVRKLNEPGCQQSTSRAATRVASVAEVNPNVLSVTLEHNRFCFCKGSSHESNNIRLVVMKDKGIFHQKCFDIDCRHFSSAPFTIPAWLLEDENDDAELFGSFATPSSGKRAREEGNDNGSGEVQPVKQLCMPAQAVTRMPNEPTTPLAVTPVARSTALESMTPPRPVSQVISQPGLAAGVSRPNSHQSVMVENSDDEVIGADPDELVGAQADEAGAKDIAAASQESTDWFDVSKLW